MRFASASAPALLSGALEAWERGLDDREAELAAKLLVAPRDAPCTRIDRDAPCTRFSCILWRAWCVCVCVVVSSVCVVVFGRSGRCGARPPGGPSGIRQTRWKGLLR